MIVSEKAIELFWQGCPKNLNPDECWFWRAEAEAEKIVAAARLHADTVERNLIRSLQNCLRDLGAH